jgi:hypothetical protein
MAQTHAPLSIRKTSLAKLLARGGHDWTKWYPWIVEAALKNRHKQFVLDGEAVVLGVNGISDFNALHSGKYNRSNSMPLMFSPWTAAKRGGSVRHKSMPRRPTPRPSAHAAN